MTDPTMPDEFYDDIEAIRAGIAHQAARLVALRAWRKAGGYCVADAAVNDAKVHAAFDAIGRLIAHYRRPYVPSDAEIKAYCRAVGWSTHADTLTIARERLIDLHAQGFRYEGTTDEP